MRMAILKKNPIHTTLLLTQLVEQANVPHLEFTGVVERQGYSARRRLISLQLHLC